MFSQKTILITGGTGSFGRTFVRHLLTNPNPPKKIIVFARDEYKHFTMQSEFSALDKLGALRNFIGDVRDKNRLYRAFDGVDYVVHAAALKQIPLCEYNPFEAVQTNIMGAENVLSAAIDCGVRKVVALSTDKAVNPVNLYGATKLCSDKIFISGNAYAGGSKTCFSVVRYGNVSGSRGSVIPFFRELKKNRAGYIPITDPEMTRFWITLDEGVDLVVKALAESKGGETYISKIPSYRVLDLARAIAPEIETKVVGIRPGEKLHEVMVTEDDSRSTYEYPCHYIIYPQLDFWNNDTHFHHGGKSVPNGFRYCSGTNPEWLSTEELQEKLKGIE